MKTASPSSSFVYLVRFPLLLSIAALLVMGTFSKRGWFDWQRIRSENERLEFKIASTQKEKIQLQTEVRLFERNHDTQERVVRQILGYIRPNETVIEFQ